MLSPPLNPVKLLLLTLNCHMCSKVNQAPNSPRCLDAVFPFGCYNPKHQPVPLDYMSHTRALQTPSQWTSLMKGWKQEIRSLIQTRLTPWVSCCSRISHSCACGGSWSSSCCSCSSLILSSASCCRVLAASSPAASLLLSLPPVSHWGGFRWCSASTLSSGAPGPCRTTLRSCGGAPHSWTGLLSPQWRSKSRERWSSLQDGRWSSPQCRGRESGCRGTGPPPWSHRAATGPRETQLLPESETPRW